VIAIPDYYWLSRNLNFFPLKFCYSGNFFSRFFILRTIALLLHPRGWEGCEIRCDVYCDEHVCTELKHAIFPNLWVLQRFKTAKVTFILTGHWQSCHLIGHTHTHAHTHAHTHNHFMASWIVSGTIRVSQHQKGKTRKVKPIWIYWSKRSVSGSGISWTICKIWKSAP